MKINSTIVLVTFLIFYGCSNKNGNEKIEASGTIEATNITVSSKIAGEIKSILFDEGSKVLAGDTIIILDNEIYLLQLKQAEALSLISEAQFQLSKKGARNEDIAQAEALLNQSEINYLQAKKDKERFETLYATNSVTNKQYEDVLLKFKIASEQYYAAKENLNKVKNFTRPEELKQAEGKFIQAKANEELIRKYIRDSYVTAPSNGIIAKKFVEKGETVTQMSSLFKISDLSNVELIIYVSEEELGKVKLGQKAEIFVDAYKEKSFSGEIIYISPEAEFTPKNIQTKDERTKLVFAVKIKIKNPDYELKPGMPADAIIKL